jgi:ParB-like nuclease domain
MHSAEQIDQIAASIREWGWTVPVLIDEQGGIIAGHGRVLAAHKLAIAEIPGGNHRSPIDPRSYGRRSARRRHLLHAMAWRRDTVQGHCAGSLANVRHPRVATAQRHDRNIACTKRGDANRSNVELFVRRRARAMHADDYRRWS